MIADLQRVSSRNGHLQVFCGEWVRQSFLLSKFNCGWRWVVPQFRFYTSFPFKLFFSPVKMNKLVILLWVLSGPVDFRKVLRKRWEQASNICKGDYLFRPWTLFFKTCPAPLTEWKKSQQNHQMGGEKRPSGRPWWTLTSETTSASVTTLVSNMQIRLSWKLKQRKRRERKIRIW